MTFFSKQRLLAAAAIAGLVVAVCVPIALHSRLNTALADAERARQATLSALGSVTDARKLADSTARQAKIAEASRDSAIAYAGVAAITAARARGSFAAVASAAPDTCAIVIAAANSALASQDSVVTDLRVALRSSQAATTDLSTALDTTRAALTRLQGAAAPLASATAQLEHAAKPSIFARLIPKFGLGGAAGVDAFGRPNAVIGVTLGWSF